MLVCVFILRFHVLVISCSIHLLQFASLREALLQEESSRRDLQEQVAMMNASISSLTSLVQELVAAQRR